MVSLAQRGSQLSRFGLIDARPASHRRIDDAKELASPGAILGERRHALDKREPSAVSIPRRIPASSSRASAAADEQLTIEPGQQAPHLPAEQLAALDAATTPETAMIYGLFTPAGRQNFVFGGSAVASR